MSEGGECQEVGVKVEHLEERNGDGALTGGFSGAQQHANRSCFHLFCSWRHRPKCYSDGEGEDLWVPSDLSCTSTEPPLQSAGTVRHVLKIMVGLKIIEWVGLEGTLEGHLVQPPCSERGHLHIDEKKVTKPRILQNPSWSSSRKDITTQPTAKTW